MCAVVATDCSSLVGPSSEQSRKCCAERGLLRWNSAEQWKSEGIGIFVVSAAAVTGIWNYGRRQGCVGGSWVVFAGTTVVQVTVQSLLSQESS